ncbi:thiamine pyrophosphate-dependent enzyme [Actinomadura macra]|uniref:thiamine pyrophosphate-dependent enzyme n=1 Tax=Actinomadura macra TaxID=46164 RepID=UPI00083009D0|nr:thiamine pyrophosphate-dependent enzyme [Actinomadura macra]
MSEPADVHFLEKAAALRPPEASPPPPSRLLTDGRLLELFDAQMGSRHLDLAARRLRADGHGFYTIGSAGHEGGAAVAAALRPEDPALLHYRSGAFFLERARQVPGGNALRDILLGLVAAAADPVSGGRHKVFGGHRLNVIPQTSTIASHLPRALGVAFAIERAARLGLDAPWPRDAVTVCGFGDASANHSTATGAINAAVNCGYQGLPMPLLLVCEDNGIGISVRTPPGWIHAAYGSRPGLAYFRGDGCDLEDAYDAACRAAAWVRAHRRPAFLHLRTVRLMGHAGSDVETSYRTSAEIAADLEADPLLGTARLLVDRGAATAAEIVALYEAKRVEVATLAGEVAGSPRLASAAEVMAPLAAPVRTRPAPDRPVHDRPAGEPATVAQAINRTLGELLDERPGLLVFGEDVARKGGVYGVTRGLARRAGAARVFDTILDEQSILGLALGLGLAGMVPVPEIQYLAYLHNAADQIRGEAATLPFFSAGRYRNPMVVRIAAYAYQKGFGGHFHNDNAVAALRDVPGLVIASPARPDDAAGMLRTCVDAAEDAGRVCVLLEPIALYHHRDLYEDGDGGWLAAPGSAAVPLGRARVYGTGGDVTIVTYANGLRMSLRAARRLEGRGVRCRVLDLRWIAPLPVDDLLREAAATGAVLVADETRRTGGVSEAVLTALADRGFRGRAARVTSEDSFIPLGDAAYHVLLSENVIEVAVLRLVGGQAGTF